MCVCHLWKKHFQDFFFVPTANDFIKSVLFSFKQYTWSTTFFQGVEQNCYIEHLDQLNGRKRQTRGKSTMLLYPYNKSRNGPIFRDLPRGKFRFSSRKYIDVFLFPLWSPSLLQQNVCGVKMQSYMTGIFGNHQIFFSSIIFSIAFYGERENVDQYTLLHIFFGFVNCPIKMTNLLIQIDSCGGNTCPNVHNTIKLVADNILFFYSIRIAESNTYGSKSQIPIP